MAGFFLFYITETALESFIKMLRVPKIIVHNFLWVYKVCNYLKELNLDKSCV